MVSWFVLIYLSTFSNSLFTNCCNSILDLLDTGISRFALSANSFTLKLLAEEKSFIYMRNNKRTKCRTLGHSTIYLMIVRFGIVNDSIYTVFYLTDNFSVNLVVNL